MTSKSGECGVILPQHRVSLSHLNELLYNKRFSLWCECRKAFFSLASHTYVQIHICSKMLCRVLEVIHSDSALHMQLLYFSWPDLSSATAVPVLFYFLITVLTVETEFKPLRDVFAASPWTTVLTILVFRSFENYFEDPMLSLFSVKEKHNFKVSTLNTFSYDWTCLPMKFKD